MSFASVPIIDVGVLVDELSRVHAQDDDNNDPASHLSPQALRACQQLHEASRDVGFFYVRNHGIPLEHMSELQRVSHVFFNLPEEEKKKVSMQEGGRAWRGWFQLGGELTSGRPDQKEGYYFGTQLPLHDPLVVAKCPMHGPNVFPEEKLVPFLATTVLRHMDHCTHLGMLLLQALALALFRRWDMRNYFFNRFHAAQRNAWNEGRPLSDGPTRLFRIFRYPPHRHADEADEWGVREHTDYGVLTLLLQDDCGGLQVLSQRGKEKKEAAEKTQQQKKVEREGDVWIEAPPVEGTLVVNLGDMLDMWTHGLYRATVHRVRNKDPTRDRYSFPFFLDPCFDAPLYPIDADLLKHLPEMKERDANPDKVQRPRWDGLDMQKLRSGITYGQYVLAKVSKVFPQLGEETQVVSEAATKEQMMM